MPLFFDLRETFQLWIAKFVPDIARIKNNFLQKYKLSRVCLQNSEYFTFNAQFLSFRLSKEPDSSFKFRKVDAAIAGLEFLNYNMVIYYPWVVLS